MNWHGAINSGGIGLARMLSLMEVTVLLILAVPFVIGVELWRHRPRGCWVLGHLYGMDGGPCGVCGRERVR